MDLSPWVSRLQAILLKYPSILTYGVTPWLRLLTILNHYFNSSNCNSQKNTWNPYSYFSRISIRRYWKDGFIRRDFLHRIKDILCCAALFASTIWCFILDVESIGTGLTLTVAFIISMISSIFLHISEIGLRSKRRYPNYNGGRNSEMTYPTRCWCSCSTWEGLCWARSFFCFELMDEPVGTYEQLVAVSNPAAIHEEGRCYQLQQGSGERRLSSSS